MSKNKNLKSNIINNKVIDINDTMNDKTIGIKNFKGQRLKNARLYRGMTIKELAEEVGVTKQAISQFENNITTPKFDNLRRISKCLRFPLDYFLEEDRVNQIIGSTFFRSYASMSKKEEYIQKEKIRLIGLIYSFLNEYIVFPELNIPELDEELTIEEKAMELRNHWNLGLDPIEDLVYVLEKNGIIISSMYVDSNNVDAFSQPQVIDGEERYIIVLGNDKNSATRRQFSAAHELGHIVLHDKFLEVDNMTREEVSNIEKEANEFASAFLLPRESFIEDIKLYSSDLGYYKMLKKKWRVSISAMIVRANRLGVISNSVYQSMMRKMSSLGWRKEEPLDSTLEINHPIVLKKAVDVLLDNEVFDEKTIVDELSKSTVSLDRREIEELLGLEKDKLKPKKLENNLIEIPLK